MMDIPAARRELVARLFPGGVPRLWCPTLTHFRPDGALDEERIGRHLAAIAPHVKGILVPGSTGEGWEMDDADIRALLDVVLGRARHAGVRVLVGVLKTDHDAMDACIRETADWLRERSGKDDAAEAMAACGVVGFTVCPPKGTDKTQEEIAGDLEDLLALGYPTALYQLPQVTGNEMAPATVSELAARFANFILLKDTSGADRVALSGEDLGGVFLVRGAEGDYTRWPRSAGGPYDGYLLSTANCFAPQLARMLDLLDEGRAAEAGELVARVERVVAPCFEMVGGFATGNPFTNANKTFDHVFAWGEAWHDHKPPRLYSGARLPAPYIERAASLLRAENLFPDRGYMQD